MTGGLKVLVWLAQPQAVRIAWPPPKEPLVCNQLFTLSSLWISWPLHWAVKCLLERLARLYLSRLMPTLVFILKATNGVAGFWSRTDLMIYGPALLGHVYPVYRISFGSFAKLQNTALSCTIDLLNTSDTIFFGVYITTCIFTVLLYRGYCTNG